MIIQIINYIKKNKITITIMKNEIHFLKNKIYFYFHNDNKDNLI